MEARLSIISLGVKDLEKARKFYQQGLGFPVADISTSEIVFLKTNGTCLALYPVDKLADDIGIEFNEYKPGFKGSTIAHNTRRKDEVDEILRAAQDAGGKVLKPASDTFWGGYSGYFSDLDGHIWEVAYADFWKFDAVGNLALD